MPSRFENQLAAEHARVFDEFVEDVTRRPGGDAARGYVVSGVIVQLDNKAASVVASRGGLLDSERGVGVEEGAVLILPLATDQTMHDHWVVRGKLYVALGGVVDSDAATKTIVVVRQRMSRGRESRTSSRGQ